MDRQTFLIFMGPTLVAMTILIALPLVGVVYLSTLNSYIKTELKEVEETNPLTGTVKKTISQPVLDENGNPIRIWENVGIDNYRSLIELDSILEIIEDEVEEGINALEWLYQIIADVAFLSALEFTVLYVLITTPFVIILGFLSALAVNKMTNRLKAIFIPATLLPFIITPVVGALSIKWLFIDNAVITVMLENIGFGKIYFLESKWTTRFLIILYGVWHVTPFAFVVLYAGLQTISEDALEAARVDGASKFQCVWYVVIPSLIPLFVFVSLIHVMDAYRVFEPVFVFSGGNHATSLQFLTYDILATESNFFKASAAAVATIIGVILLLSPMIIRTYREYRRGL